MSAITYMDHEKNFRTYRFSTIIQHGCSKDLYQKLRYAHEKLSKMLEKMFFQFFLFYFATQLLEHVSLTPTRAKNSLQFVFFLFVTFAVYKAEVIGPLPPHQIYIYISVYFLYIYRKFIFCLFLNTFFYTDACFLLSILMCFFNVLLSLVQFFFCKFTLKIFF